MSNFNNAKSFAAWIFGAIFGAAFVLFFAFLSLPLSQPTYINLFATKNYINSLDSQNQRIVISAGSGTLFGFNGDVMKQENLTLVNFGSGAGLPLETIVDMLISNAKRGDIVFLPLEFTYYTRESSQNDPQYIQNQIAFDRKNIFTIPPLLLLKSIAKSNPAEMPIYFVNKFFIEKESDPIAKMRSIWESGEYKFQGYNFKSLDKYGSYRVQGAFVNSDDGFLDVNLELSENFLQQFFRLQKWANENDVKIFLTYPATMRNAKFDLDSENADLKNESWAKIQNLEEKLSEQGIRIYGNPNDFHFERQYFFDTPYHLNEQGAILRTKAFLKFLRNLQQDEISESKF